MFECESCGSTSYYGHFCRPCKQQAIQINISMDLKYLIDQLCHAHYQAGVFWAAGLPLKKTNNFIDYQIF